MGFPYLIAEVSKLSGYRVAMYKIAWASRTTPIPEYRFAV